MERKKINPSEEKGKVKSTPPQKRKLKIPFRVVCVCLVIVVAVFTGIFVINRNVSEETKKDAEIIVNAFKQKDMIAITQCIYGESVAGEEIDSSKLMRALFEETDLEVVSVTKSTITYAITAADVSQVFNDWFKEEPNLDEIDDAEFVSHIAEYSKQAELKMEKVKVPYDIENNVFSAEYTSFEFLDAVTGHFLSAYEEQYTSMMDGYREALGEEDAT